MDYRLLTVDFRLKTKARSQQLKANCHLPNYKLPNSPTTQLSLSLPHEPATPAVINSRNNYYSTQLRTFWAIQNAGKTNFLP